MSSLPQKGFSASGWRVRLPLCLALSLCLPPLFFLIPPAAPHNGFWWDVAIGIGLSATGFLIAVPLISPRIWRHQGGEPRYLGAFMLLHFDMSYAAVALVCAHAIGVVVLEPLNVEYLKLSAPWSMLAAVLGLILMIALLVSSIYRRRFKLRFRQWWLWHVGLSLAILTCVVYHILDAGFYVNSPLKQLSFTALATGPSLVALGARTWRSQQRWGDIDERRSVPWVPTSRRASVWSVALLAGFSVVLIALFSIPKDGPQAAEPAKACSTANCD